MLRLFGPLGPLPLIRPPSARVIVFHVSFHAIMLRVRPPSARFIAQSGQRELLLREIDRGRPAGTPASWSPRDNAGGGKISRRFLETLPYFRHIYYSY